MTTYTTNLNLKKPGYEDLADIADVNANMDVIDEEFGNKVDNSRVLSDVPLNAEFTDTIYTHPTTAGNKHIPTGGTVGQILKNTASGTVGWANETTTPVVDNLTSTDTGKALSANQGNVLAEQISTVSGEDRTTETVKGNSDNLITHKASTADHNGFIGSFSTATITNFNDSVTPGSYFGLASGAITNEPVTSTSARYNLIVEDNGTTGVITQTLRYIDGPPRGRIFYRTRIGFSWSTWLEMPTRGYTGSAVPATTGTVDLVADSETKSLTPSGDCVINLWNGSLGQRFTLVIITSGTTSRTITFSSQFKAQGTLVTGATSGKYFAVSFIYDGTYWVETGRTAAM